MRPGDPGVQHEHNAKKQTPSRHATNWFELVVVRTPSELKTASFFSGPIGAPVVHQAPRLGGLREQVQAPHGWTFDGALACCA